MRLSGGGILRMTLGYLIAEYRRRPEGDDLWTKRTRNRRRPCTPWFLCAEALGIEILVWTPEEVRARLEWTEQRCTLGGMLHGGSS